MAFWFLQVRCIHRICAWYICRVFSPDKMAWEREGCWARFSESQRLLRLAIALRLDIQAAFARFPALDWAFDPSVFRNHTFNAGYQLLTEHEKHHSESLRIPPWPSRPRRGGAGTTGGRGKRQRSW